MLETTEKVELFLLFSVIIQVSMLDKEYAYYKKHKTELFKNFKNKYLVIIGEEVVGNYDTESEAYSKAINQYKLGTFLIQHCVDDETETLQTFHSRVIF